MMDPGSFLKHGERADRAVSHSDHHVLMKDVTADSTILFRADKHS